MIPVAQTLFASDAPPYGNCVQAAVASILELPSRDVPHFVENGGEWWPEFARWCASRGLWVAVIEAVPGFRPVGWHLGSGGSPRGPYAHVCVYRDGTLAHDPHPDGGGLTEVRDWWLFVPLDPARIPLWEAT